MWRAYTYYILGVRPVLQGLLVDPKIPNGWEGYRLKRPFRGAIFDIEVSNPQGMNSGVKSVEIDGERIPGNVIPSRGDGRTHRVKVALGS
jgi:cellobiose phosphorylase